MRNTITNLFRLRDKDDISFAAEVLAFTDNIPSLPKEIKDFCDYALEFFTNKGYFPDAETVNRETGLEFTSVPMEDPAAIVFKLRELQGEMREKYSSKVLMDVVAEKNIEKKKEMLDEVSRIAFSTELRVTDMVSVTKPEAPISDLVEKHREKRAGLYTNIPELDSVVDGFLLGSMTTVCGYAGHGKTQFAVNMVYHNAVNRGYNALVLTKEIPADYYRINLLARHSREIGQPINAEKLKKGTVTDAELKVIRDVEEDLKSRAKGDIIVLDESAEIDYSPFGFGPFLESLYSKYKFEMLAIDYLQLFRNHTPKNMKELDYLNRIVSTVRAKSVCIGKKDQIASVMLSQANREGYKQALLTGGKYPLSALSEANALERDSRYVVFLYFDELLRSSSEIKLTLAKHRGGVTIEDPITTPFEPQYFYMGESAKDSGVHRNTYSVESIKEFMKL